jgi:hypothetical protein
MKLSDLQGWHSFTYTQLYPAVLGSMLYDVLKFDGGWLFAIKFSVTTMFMLDYLHLYRDIRSSDEDNAGWLETGADAYVAVALGAAYLQYIEKHFVVGTVWIVSTFVVFLFYNVKRRIRFPRKIRYFTAMFASTIAVLAMAATGITGPNLALVSWIMPTLYFAYIFGGPVLPTKQ